MSLPPPQGDEGSETTPSAKPYPCLVSDPLASAERSEAEGVKAPSPHREAGSCAWSQIASRRHPRDDLPRGDFAAITLNPA